MGDSSIDALTCAQRSELVEVWLARAASERRVADAFDVVSRALEALESKPEVIALARRAVDDEHRHAELCRIVASRVAGQDLAPPAHAQLVVPEHPGADPKLRLTLHVVGQCALNETFASAFLEASLAQARGELAQAALRELLSDEIDHARIGWAHIATLGEKERTALAPWMLSLVRANLKMWRDMPRPYPTDEALHAQGAPSAESVEQALIGAIRDLILPGLERFGLPTATLSAWLASGAPTT